MRAVTAARRCSADWRSAQDMMDPIRERKRDALWPV
jgi:hypothetical protein